MGSSTLCSIGQALFHNIELKQWESKLVHIGSIICLADHIQNESLYLIVA